MKVRFWCEKILQRRSAAVGAPHRPLMRRTPPRREKMGSNPGLNPNFGTFWPIWGADPPLKAAFWLAAIIPPLNQQLAAATAVGYSVDSDKTQCDKRWRPALRSAKQPTHINWSQATGSADFSRKLPLDPPKTHFFPLRGPNGAGGAKSATLAVPIIPVTLRGVLPPQG